MKKSQFELAIKKFNQKFDCKLKITKFEKCFGDYENHSPFNTGEDRLNLEKGKDGNLYFGSRIFCQKSSFRVSGTCPEGEAVEKGFVFDSLHDFSENDFEDYLDDKFRF